MPLVTAQLRRFRSLSYLLAVLAAAAAGCGQPSSTGDADKSASGDAAAGSAQGSSPGASTAAAGELTIISPHSPEIQNEFERLFKQKHPQASVKWLDQGGTSSALRYVQGRFASAGKTSGINVDLFFGGGGEAFLEMEKDGLLQPLPSDYTVPAELHGVPLRGKGNTWVAAALSGFGILYNKSIVEREKLPLPALWADLGKPALRDRIELADPRHSGTAHATFEIILQNYGWERGWQVLTSLAGNARTFATEAGRLVQDVSNGEASLAPAIDFYARAALARAGDSKLGFIEPKGQRVMTPDPIAILRGAPNLELARQFVAVVMSQEGQKLWMLKKGVPGGPVENELYRQAALPALYKPLPAGSLVSGNPYAERNARPFDARKAALRRRPLDDLLGSVLIDNHDAVRSAWEKTPDPAKLTFVPVSEAALARLAPQWGDSALRNKTTAQWAEAAAKHFGQS